ncbi:hypothetical protein PG994_007113 [Apiospora phragmitis]|uniref:Ubiquitin-like protease family profile domain-containing protein n=1 Tax=Apiospora phragmitis TaxID=2905665 RepID=A0ABR1V2I1_9PEZI
MGKSAKVHSDDPGVHAERDDLYERALTGLNSLQKASHTPVNRCAMDVVIDTLKKSLPKAVRSQVYCAPDSRSGLWSDDEAKHEAAMAKMAAIAKGELQPVFLLAIAKVPHVIWPLWVDDEFSSHWVVLYWHSTPVPKAQEVFPHIQEVRLFDPAMDYGYVTSAHKENYRRRERITHAFARFLGFFLPIYATDGVASLRWRRKGKGQTTANGLLRGFHAHFDDCVEPEERASEGNVFRHNATGERCYSFIKQLLAGIVEQETALPRDYYEPHREHLGRLAYADPYLARIEMAGICAWKCMEARDFQARIAIEPLPADHDKERISVLTKGGKRYYLDPQALQRPGHKEAKVVTRNALHRAREERLRADEEETARQGGPPGPEGQNVRHRTNCMHLNPAATPRASIHMSIFQSDLPATTSITRKRSSSVLPEGQAHAKKARVGPPPLSGHAVH